MCKVYGYCRISTPAQNIQRQIRNILGAYPEAKIIEEVYTGKVLSRPKFERMIAQVKRDPEGKTIVFDSVSRMSRSAAEGFQLYKELYHMGVSLVFLKEPQINTDTFKAALAGQVTIPPCGDVAGDQFMAAIADAINNYMMALAEKQIELAFAQAQKEVDDLRQRTTEGMETARKAGKQIGQVKGAKLHSKVSQKVEAVIRQHSKTFGGSLDDAECMRLAGCCRGTYYKVKRSMRMAPPCGK